MRRSRYEYYFRAIICFAFSTAFILIPIFKPSLVKKAGVSIGAGIGIGILFLLIGLINYFIAKGNSDSERKRIKEYSNLKKN